MPVYKITNKGANKCLNIYGNNVTSLVNNQNVTLYSDSGTNEQKWEVTGLGSIMTIKSVIDTDFSLHADLSKTPYNCDVYKWKNNSGGDYVVDFVASGSSYKIRLSSYPNLYLTASGTDVIWAAPTNNDYQLWNCSVVTAPVNPYAAFNWSYFAGDAKYCTREFQGTHKAIDLIKLNGTTQGISITSPCSGIVFDRKNWDHERGNYIIIESTNVDPQSTSTKLKIILQHMTAPAPSTLTVGSSVSKGTLVGHIGNSGHVNSGGVDYRFGETDTDKITGAHLHAEVIGAAAIRPSWFYPGVISGNTTPYQ